MSLFFKTKSEKQNQIADLENTSGVKKGHATPKRKAQEARNYRPLIGDTSKEGKARARAARDEAFRREQEGLRTGREDLLPALHRGKARRFIRDWIDSRYTISEWMIILVLVIIMAGMIISSALAGGVVAKQIQINNIFMMVAWGIILVSLIEGLINTFLATRKAKEKFGQDKDFPTGLRWYAFSRGIQIRRWRSPRPQVKRGEVIS